MGWMRIQAPGRNRIAAEVDMRGPMSRRLPIPRSQAPCRGAARRFRPVQSPPGRPVTRPRGPGSLSIYAHRLCRCWCRGAAYQELLAAEFLRSSRTSQIALAAEPDSCLTEEVRRFLYCRTCAENHAIGKPTRSRRPGASCQPGSICSGRATSSCCANSTSRCAWT